MAFSSLLGDQVSDVQHPGGRGHYGLSVTPLPSNPDVCFRDVRVWRVPNVGQGTLGQDPPHQRVAPLGYAPVACHVRRSSDRWGKPHVRDEILGLLNLPTSPIIEEITRAE